MFFIISILKQTNFLSCQWDSPTDCRFIVGVFENVCVVTSVWSADCVHELCSLVYDESWADNFPIFGLCYDLADRPQFHRPHIDLTCPT